VTANALSIDGAMRPYAPRSIPVSSSESSAAYQPASHTTAAIRMMTIPTTEVTGSGRKNSASPTMITPPTPSGSHYSLRPAISSLRDDNT
jgi:hypothetical protein